MNDINSITIQTVLKLETVLVPDFNFCKYLKKCLVDMSIDKNTAVPAVHSQYNQQQLWRHTKISILKVRTKLQHNSVQAVSSASGIKTILEALLSISCWPLFYQKHACEFINIRHFKLLCLLEWEFMCFTRTKNKLIKMFKMKSDCRAKIKPLQSSCFGF